MVARLITGNEAVALGALQAGVKAVTGYPGTPSTGVIAGLLAMAHPGTYVEWSVNEKVALEVAVGLTWGGHRALCTMKMSGVNVAYDSLISIAYSGTDGGLVIYVADDPGTSAGMCEQDSRGFALMSDLPMLEPASVAEAYRMMPLAFELSEATGTPVFVRLVTALANTYGEVEVADPPGTLERETQLVRDIARYTKAGAVVCMAQHRDLIARLAQAGEWIRARGLNRLQLAERPGGLGIIACGVVGGYLDEGLEIARQHGLNPEDVSILKLAATVPFPAEEVRALLGACSAILVLEELEPYAEKSLYVEAAQLGYQGRIIGKLKGPLQRVGEYGVRQVLEGLAEAVGMPELVALYRSQTTAERLAAERPITTCAGCPHRGTYMAINKALKKERHRLGDVMVTGDIGCTILGMNPPFYTVWNEISMGASISLAQGFVHAGTRTPVLATIGDSTFFHGGIPGLINAVQHQVSLTLVIMDNGWTAMTGMQVNPGTATAFQPAEQRVDIPALVRALGVEHTFVVDPYDLESATNAIREALGLPGVKVVVSQRECAIQAARRGLRAGRVSVNAELCNLCKLCIMETGCAAITLGEAAIEIDPALCFGCGLCAGVCNRDAIRIEALVEAMGGVR